MGSLPSFALPAAPAYPCSPCQEAPSPRAAQGRVGTHCLVLVVMTAGPPTAPREQSGRERRSGTGGSPERVGSCFSFRTTGTRTLLVPTFKRIADAGRCHIG